MFDIREAEDGYRYDKYGNWFSKKGDEYVNWGQYDI